MHSSEKLSGPVIPKDEQRKARRYLRMKVEEAEAAAKEVTDAEIDTLRKAWYDSAKDVICEVPLKLPPMRAINHRIPLIDESKVDKYHLPRCPDVLKSQLRDKIIRYTKAGWWEERTTSQAAPMLCIPKKNGNLRTVIDCRKRNDNTWKDITPFPDQDQIRHDVAAAKYRSKIDMSDAYEQIRIMPEDVWKTAFSTVYGTFVSHTMQQGDCNAPATFQRLMTHIFREYIGDFVHVYMDDIFIYSDTVEDHQRHIGLVLDKLRENHLYLVATKCDFYSTQMDCLGHLIDEHGIHADSDKMSKVRNWPTPKTYNEVQRFLGLVQYLSSFMPDVSMYSSVLSGMVRNGREFLWRPIHEHCFRMIKEMACKYPILKPIDPKSSEPIWVVCDASIYGVGVIYGQGEDWQSCRPAGFMSKRFTAAQRNYRTYEQETLAMIEALAKWSDKLLGRKFTIVTDHKALEFFDSQKNLTPRQTRWSEFLQPFNATVKYVKGRLNKVADCFSRYYKRVQGELPSSEYANMDAILDPDGDDLMPQRVLEIRAMKLRTHRKKVTEESRYPTLVADKVFQRPPEPRENEVAVLEEFAEPTAPEKAQTAPEDRQYTLEKELQGNLPDVSLDAELENTSQGWLKSVSANYGGDSFFKKIIEAPEQYSNFEYNQTTGNLWTYNRSTDRVLCVPNGKLGERSLRELAISSAHTVVGHLGAEKTSAYIRHYYWWPGIGSDVEKFCTSCSTCQTTKSSPQKPAGLLHSLPIPNQPWESIAMDFVGPFPKSSGYDYMWVVIDRKTSMVHLILITTKVTTGELAELYLWEIIRLHGFPSSIVSDRDTKFTAIFWKELHRIVGTKLMMSTSFHPQTDGASERAIQTISKMLRSMVEPTQADWVEWIPMVEFALNSTVSSSTGYAPFELNYGYIPRWMTTPVGESPYGGVSYFAERARSNLLRAHDAIIESRVNQTYYANRKRRDAPKYAKGQLVYLSTKNLNLPKGRARKLLPK